MPKNKLENLEVFRRLFVAAFGSDDKNAVLNDFNFAPRQIDMRQFAKITREAMNIAIEAKKKTVKSLKKGLKAG